jgi:predicted Zn-dependent protease
MWSAIYHDGIYATGQKARVSVDGDALAILAENGSPLSRWALKETRLLAGSAANDAIRLRHGLVAEDRLTIADLSILELLEAKCPNLRRTAPDWRTTLRSSALWVLAAAASLVLLVKVVVPVMAEQFAAIVPQELERRIGEQLANQIVTTFSHMERQSEGSQLCQNKAAQAALDGLAARLTEEIVPALHLNIRVVNLKVINALALPGGQILVFRGLLEFAENGDELAGVLAHELGHVILRHPLEVAIKGASVSILASLIVGDITGGAAIAGVAAAFLTAAYGQEAEHGADALAVSLLNGAGFDSRNVADLFERFGRKAREKEGVLSRLSSHPLSRERAQNMRAMAQTGQTAFDANAWQAIRAMCR